MDMHIEDLMEKFKELYPIEDNDVDHYSSEILKCVKSNYDDERYQFAYFGVHLLFMTYLYCVIWQISKLCSSRFLDTTIFAQTYKGKEKKLKFNNIESVFDLSYMKESDISSFLLLIDMDPSFVGQIKSLVEDRNDMAHANGKIQIKTYDEYQNAIHSIEVIIKNIEKKMEVYIKNCYGTTLALFWEKGKIDNFENWESIITDYLVIGYGLSRRQTRYCTNFGLTRIKNSLEYKPTKEQLTKLNELHNATIKVYSNYLE